MSESHIYIAIDSKSFFASVECIEQHLNPLTTNLVVADVERTEKTICLAVTPSLKAYGISGRSRLFEVVQRVKEVNIERKSKAPDRQFTGSSYLSTEDIHVYSIDEVFMDVTHYLNTYKVSAKELASMIIRDVLSSTGITATAGIGSNLYLCKVAMDKKDRQI